MIVRIDKNYIIDIKLVNTIFELVYKLNILDNE